MSKMAAYGAVETIIDISCYCDFLRDQLRSPFRDIAPLEATRTARFIVPIYFLHNSPRFK